MQSSSLQKSREKISALHFADEQKLARQLADEIALTNSARKRISARALEFVKRIRSPKSGSLLESILAEYGLSSGEGVALMCLAEALLRVPDSPTADALIRDKIAPADWRKHLGHSASPLVNAATWALLLTGKVVHESSGEDDIPSAIRRMISRIGEPLARKAAARAMAILGGEFVLGQTIGEAFIRGQSAAAKGFLFSYDMLGESACTQADAHRYFLSYQNAVAELAKRTRGSDFRKNAGISIKLSALHPRVEWAKRARLKSELLPRLAELSRAARSGGIGLTIDAEECFRLEPTLEILQAAATLPDICDWDGFGVAVQAYQKRARGVLDFLSVLSHRRGARLCVRLVKGAYWDLEIKRAQILGLRGYPVFTRKSAADLSYLACARFLLQRKESFYPQFATHNAHTAAAVLEIAKEENADDFEFQRLHGMGARLFDILQKEIPRARIYAPVGPRRDLLAYLVRRLLENGAAASFVHRLMDDSVADEVLASDPIAIAKRNQFAPHPRISLPSEIYGARKNSRGMDLSDPTELNALCNSVRVFSAEKIRASPIINGEKRSGVACPIFNPSFPNQIVGEVADANSKDADDAFAAAAEFSREWNAESPENRAAALDSLATRLEESAAELIALAAREGGKTLADGIAEVREAADFCRYYAAESQRLFADENRRGRGIVVCISPWNFPLAIFIGQIAAALAAGNAVVAKPAEQTPLIAFRAVELAMESLPKEAINFLPGGGELGDKLVGDSRANAVCFTGATATARTIFRAMANRGNPFAPLIAETGGVNAMIADSTALPEQAVHDITASAFSSAGQRCSALRVLYLQEEIAPAVLEMICGAADEFSLGDPCDPAADAGPLIDREALENAESHARQFSARLAHRTAAPKMDGFFCAPAIFRVSGIDEIKREVFAPMLHVAEFASANLGAVVAGINAAGWGLTMAAHTRIEARVRDIAAAARVGNLYINRDQIGATVGAQPFGGEGLSGTGPKAGGTHILERLSVLQKESRRIFLPQINSDDENFRARKSDGDEIMKASARANRAREKWNDRRNRGDAFRRAESLLREKTPPPYIGDSLLAAAKFADDFFAAPSDLPHTAGERNFLFRTGRGVFIFIGGDGENLFRAIAFALAAGNAAICESHNKFAAAANALCESGMPSEIFYIAEKSTDAKWLRAMQSAEIAGAVILNSPQAAETAKILSAREGMIIPLIADSFPDAAYFFAERTVSINTAAAGGDAALLLAADE